MSLDQLRLSKDAQDFLREHGIQSIDQARLLTRWENLFEKRELYIERESEINEVQRAVANYDQQKGSAFRDSYVAFIDILGFAQLAAKADTDSVARETIRLGLRCFSSILRRHPNPDLHFAQFSDTIIFSSKRDENGLLYVLEATINVAFELLKVGMLVRGGIAAGNLEHTDEMLFGKALVDAYDLERGGGPPRIVVSETVINDGPSQRLLKEIWSSSVFLDEYDLSHAVHTLLFVETYHSDAMGRLTAAELENMARMIGNRANALGEPPPIRAKWRWMARYWNRTVSKNGRLPAIDLEGIDQEPIRSRVR